VVIEQIKFDHGYTRSSRAVGLLLDVLSEFTDAQLATFLQVTDSPQRCLSAQDLTALPHRRIAAPLHNQPHYLYHHTVARARRAGIAAPLHHHYDHHHHTAAHARVK
jgi:hypothetical protein